MTADEDALLGILRAHVGQMLPVRWLGALLTEARAARPSADGSASGEPLRAAHIAPMLQALDRKLKMTGAPERIREVSGIGYVLWR